MHVSDTMVAALDASRAMKTAVDYLAARCDFAREDDGVGFNSSDTVYGHELAETPFETWTEDDRIAVRVMLQKYVGQLEAIDVDPRTLPREDVVERLTPEEQIAREKAAIATARGGRTKARASKKAEAKRMEVRKAKHLISIVGSDFLIVFPYHREMVDQCKAIPGRKRFNNVPAGWLLRIDDVDPQRLIDYLERYQFTRPDDVNRKLVELINHPRPKAVVTTPAPSVAASMVVAPDGLSIVVAFPYSAAVVEAFKLNVAGARFEKDTKRWIVPMKPATVEGLGRFLATSAAHGFEVEPRIHTIVAAVLENAKEAIEASRASEADADFTAAYLAAIPTDELRDQYRILPSGARRFGFQIAGVRYALDKKRMIFGDEPGLGKTIQAIMTIVMAHLRGDQVWPVVCVVPAGVVYNWYREWKRFAPTRTVSILTSDRPFAGYAADVLIINYDILTKRAAKGEKRDRAKERKERTIRFSDHALGIQRRGAKSIIFDEIHLLKNHKTDRTRAAAALAKMCDWRLGLSGTFFLNRPSEGLAPLSAIGRLGDLGGFHYYTQRYCNASAGYGGGTDISGASHLDELNTKMRAKCYVRREKADVHAELPAKSWTPVFFDIDNRAEYDRIERDVARYCGQQAVRSEKFLTALDADMEAHRRELRFQGTEAAAIEPLIAEMRQKRIADFEELATDKAEKVEQLRRIAVLEAAAARGKMKAVEIWIKEFATDNKLITFATSIELQERLAALMPGQTETVLSRQTKTERDEAVQRFQDDRRKMHLVASLDRKMAIGYTATAASNVAFVNLAWSPGDMDQAIDRAHRIGQTSNVTGWLLLARNTIEGDKVELLEEKRKIVEAANIGGREIGRVSMLTELLARLAKRTAAPVENETLAF